MESPRQGPHQGPTPTKGSGVSVGSQGCGHTRDVFKQFKQQREGRCAARLKEAEVARNKYKRLAFSMSTARGDSSKWRLSWRGTLSNAAASDDKDDKDDSTECTVCKSRFTKYFKSRRVTCPMCESVCCKACTSNQLPVESGKEDKVNVCTPCWTAITKANRHDKIKSELAQADKTPFSMTHKLLVQIKAALVEDLAHFIELVQGIGEAHTSENHSMIQTASGVQGDINSLFKNFDSTLKRMGGLSTEDQRQKTLQNHIKAAFVQFLQDTLPEFKILSKQFQAVAALPITEPTRPKVVETAAAPQKRHSVTNSASTFPSISSINPAVVPLSGGRISITGQNFSNRATVEVDNSKADCEYIDSRELLVTIPPLGSGFKGIRVSNPDGTFAHLENILLYSKELDLPSSHEKVFGDISPGPSKPKPNSVNPPNISGINPVVSPLCGIQVELEGHGFHPGLMLKIDGEEIPVQLRSDSHLKFVSPPRISEGFRTIEIVNLDGGRTVLADTLYYTSNYAAPTPKGAKPISENPEQPRVAARVWGKKA